MAAAIRKELGTEPELIKGRDGVFNVAVNDTTIFSKHEVGRFPDEKEILEALHHAGSAR